MGRGKSPFSGSALIHRPLIPSFCGHCLASAATVWPSRLWSSWFVAVIVEPLPPLICLRHTVQYKVLESGKQSAVTLFVWQQKGQVLPEQLQLLQQLPQQQLQQFPKVYFWTTVLTWSISSKMGQLKKNWMCVILQSRTITNLTDCEADAKSRSEGWPHYLHQTHRPGSSGRSPSLCWWKPKHGNQM